MIVGREASAAALQRMGRSGLTLQKAASAQSVRAPQYRVGHGAGPANGSLCFALAIDPFLFPPYLPNLFPIRAHSPSRPAAAR